ncbi:MAG: DUF2795 domain-containing protein [Bradymonadaceae bacterium]
MEQERIDFRNFNLAHIRQYLKGTDYPAPREEIVEDLRKAGATDTEIEVASNLPNRLYEDTDDVLKVLNNLAGFHQGPPRSADHVRSGGKVHSDGPHERTEHRNRNEAIREDPAEGEHPGHIPKIRHRPDTDG